MVIQIGHAFFGDDHKIHGGQGVPMQAETFARQALDPVTFVGPFYMFFGDRETDTGIPQRVQAAKDGDMRRAGPLRLLEDESKMIGS